MDPTADVTDVRRSRSIVVDLNVKATDQVNGNRLTVPSIRAMFVSGQGERLQKMRAAETAAGAVCDAFSSRQAE